MRANSVACLIGLIGLITAIFPLETAAQVELVPTTRDQGGYFGSTAVIVNENEIVVGSRLSGKNGVGTGVSVPFVRQSNGNWVQGTEFTKTPVTERQTFGWSARASETAYVASSLPVNSNGDVVGGESVAIFDQETPGVWRQNKVFNSPDSVNASLFGWSVDVRGPLAVFCRNDGTIYPVRRFPLPNGGSSWAMTGSFVPPGAASFINGTVSIGDKQVAIGGATSVQRCVWLFQDNGASLVLRQFLPAPSTAPSDSTFGFWVSNFRDRWLFVTDITDDTAGNNAGITYVYRNFRGKWRQWQTLLLPNAGPLDYTGLARGALGRVAVSSIFSDAHGPDSGVVYLFSQQDNGLFGQPSELVPPTISSTDQYGSIDLSATMAVVGGAADTVPSGVPFGGQVQTGRAWVFNLPHPTNISLVPLDVVTTVDNVQSNLPTPLFGLALDNLAATDDTVTVSVDQPWLAPVAGLSNVLVKSGGTIDILLNATPEIANLEPGTHTATVTVQRQSDSKIVTAEVTLIFDPAELRVTGGAQLIPNGSSTARIEDLTDFGSVSSIPGVTTERTFVFRSSTTAPVTLQSIEVVPTTTGFSVPSVSATVEPGGIVPFTVAFNPDGTTGQNTAEIRLQYLTDQGPGTHSFVVKATKVTPPSLTPAQSGPITNPARWLPLGPDDDVLAETRTGLRSYDPASRSLLAAVLPAPVSRVVGWRESTDSDLPHSAVGPFQIVVGQFDIAREIPTTTANQDTAQDRALANFRLRLMQRFVYSSILDVRPNTANSDPEATSAALELAPSTDVSAPSRYTVVLDPIPVPFLTGSTGTIEGYQRGFEAAAEVDPTGTTPGGTDVEGGIRLLSTSISTTPRPDPFQTPIRTYGADPTDFDNPSILDLELQLDRSGLIQGQVNNLTTNTSILITRTPDGITLDTRAAEEDKSVIAAADFLEGTDFERSRPETHMRVDGERLYRVSYLLKAHTPAASLSQVRLRSRTVKFQWNHSLIIGGAYTVGSTEGRTMAGQMLPGVGSQNTNTAPYDNFWFHQYLTSPLDRAIRSDRSGSLKDRFTVLASEPGLGDPAPRSMRTLRHGIDIIDGFGMGIDAESETAEVTLRRIEVRSYVQPR